jgi:hypothetical protein
MEEEVRMAFNETGKQVFASQINFGCIGWDYDGGSRRFDLVAAHQDCPSFVRFWVYAVEDSSWLQEVGRGVGCGGRRGE